VDLPPCDELDSAVNGERDPRKHHLRRTTRVRKRRRRRVLSGPKRSFGAPARRGEGAVFGSPLCDKSHEDYETELERREGPEGGAVTDDEPPDALQHLHHREFLKLTRTEKNPYLDATYSYESKAPTLVISFLPFFSESERVPGSSGELYALGEPHRKSRMSSPASPPEETRGADVLGRLSPGQNLLLGVAAGSATISVNYPLVVWKNQSQQGLKIRAWPPQTVYRGLPMSMFTLGSTTSLQFWLTGTFQQLFAEGKKGNKEGEKRELGTAALFGGAFMGGLLSSIPCNTWELTMIQQQRFGGSMISVPLGLFREHGVSGLTRGVTMTMSRESLYTMCMLGMTPWVQSRLSRDYGMQHDMALAGGALTSAVVASYATQPFDTIKTCMQGDVGRQKFGTAMQTARTILSDSGPLGLHRGTSWRLGLVATTFYLMNKFKEVLAPVMFPADDGR
jgi:solute carrier family 25 (mitochondrial carnitine/acylcarnitine transporter), member 20/29